MSDNRDSNEPMSAARTQCTPIWSHIEKSMAPILNGEIMTNEQCDVTFSDTVQQKPRDPLGQVTITFTGSSSLSEIQRVYDGSR